MSRPGTTISALVLLVGGVSLLGKGASAQVSAPELPAALSSLAGNAALGALWSEGLVLERSEDLLASSTRYERLAESLPESSFIRWRLSRNYWRFAERLPVADKPDRLLYFGQADTWADSSLALESECGECIMWKIASLGRLATTQGVVKSARSASTIGELIDRGIALRPTYADNASNATLGNLYYAGAAFYRIVPEWRWLEWVIGVRGDKERALEYIHNALEISGARIDYQVELGAILLCMGNEAGDPGRIERGERVLHDAMSLEHLQSTDAMDIEHARIMLEHPKRACSYSRDGWIELDQLARH